MSDVLDLRTLLPAAGETPRQVALFAFVNLGVIESLSNGLLSSADALRLVFNADNCLFVRRRLRHKIADEVMSRGVQLSDLFDALPPEEAHREFQRELAKMRGLCLRLLGGERVVA